MKIRDGFVSNSSSASFTIHFESDRPREEIEEIIRKSDDYLDRYWTEEAEVEVIDIGSITSGKIESRMEKNKNPQSRNLRQVDNRFEFDVETTMFNDWHDVSGSKFAWGLSEDRIPEVKLKKIIKTWDEYSETNVESPFDPEPWQMHWENKKGEGVEVLNKYKEEYMDYLSDINAKLTEDEIIDLAKYKLNK